MEIQERIVTEAGARFAQYGIRSVTMDSLAEDMGISKRTIYENFKDKNTLLLEVVKYFKELQQQECTRILSDSENVIEALFKLISSMVNTMKQLNPSFMQDMKKYHAEIFLLISSEGEIRDHSFTKQIITKGVSQGIFRTDLNLEVVNLALHELFNFFGPDSKMTRHGYHRGELFNNIIIPYLLGISTIRGRELIEQQEKIDY